MEQPTNFNHPYKSIQLRTRDNPNFTPDIKVGDFVKVCNKKERFWVEIKKLEGNTVFAQVYTDLTEMTSYHLGDNVRFHQRKIIEIQKA